MAASDYVPIFFKNRLHLAGRPQMSTSPNDAYRLLGSYAARILRGEKPGELPRQQSVKVEL